MGKPLTWKLQEEIYDDYDPTYVEYRCWRAFSGSQRIAEVKVWYGDPNSANTTRGTVSSAHSTGKFKKMWLKRGYTWQGNYTPACKSDADPRDWVDGRWANWLAKAGL